MAVVITTPFRTADCTKQDFSRPEIERLIFRIATEMEQCLASAKRCDAYLQCVTQSPPSFAHGAVHRAVQRAGWLAEVAAALDIASKLTIALFDHDGDSGNASALRAQIRALSSEVDSIQRRRQPDVEQNNPEWMDFILFDQTPGERSPPPPNAAR